MLSEEPGHVCFVCGIYIHGELNERWGRIGDHGVSLKTNRGRVSAHTACVKCVECKEGPDMFLAGDVGNFGLCIRKLAFKEQVTYLIIHKGCRKCHNCGKTGPYRYRVESAAGYRTRKMEITWVAFPSGSDWAHRQCLYVDRAPAKEPPRKKAKLDVITG